MSAILQIKDLTLEVDYKPIKNVHLTVYPPSGRVHVSAPLSMKEEAVRLFVITKMQWIKDKREVLINRERQTERQYVAGENHYFLGQRYRLKVQDTTSAPSVVPQGKTYLVLSIREGVSVERKAEAMKDWYRKELKALLPSLIEKWEKILDVSVKYWDVKQMKTLWGSCNHSTARVLFNLELAKKPVQCIEYVVAHELTHIRIRLHNDEFIALLDEHLPTWQMLKDQLNEFIV